MDKLRLRTNDWGTIFVLAAGTVIKLGNETITLLHDTEVGIADKSLTRDAIVDTLHASGNAAANAHHFNYREERDGKVFEIRYGGGGHKTEVEVVDEAEAPKPKTRGRKPKAE